MTDYDALLFKLDTYPRDSRVAEAAAAIRDLQRQLAEAKAKTADIETEYDNFETAADEARTRAAEAEAVIEKAKEWMLACRDQIGDAAWPAVWSILDSAPSAALAEVRAQAWDEGHETGQDDQAFVARGLFSDPDADEFPHRNPYRDEASS